MTQSTLRTARIELVPLAEDHLAEDHLEFEVDLDSDPGEADLGYRLLRRRRRHGLASEGSRELLRYGFDDVA